MEDEEKKGHISDFEWQFVLAVAIFIDTIQFIIEWFDFIAIGLIINRFVSIGTALLLIFYLLYRRAHMDIRAWLSVLFATGGELIPIVSAFPLFSLDIAYIWSLNSKSILAKTAGMATGSKLTKGLQKLPPGAKPPVIQRPQAGPGAVPPRIGASGRPMAQQGATPPTIQRPQAGPGAIPPKISEIKSPPTVQTESRELRTERKLASMMERVYPSQEKITHSTEPASEIQENSESKEEVRGG